jgi:hypothetical protein
MDELAKHLGQHPESRPTIYNRPWHMDQDDRRHHGRRHWDPAAIEAFVELLSFRDGLYPPDWSDRDAVRFCAVGAGEPFAELWTDKPGALRLVVYMSDPPKPSMPHCRIPADHRHCEVHLKSPEPLRTGALTDLILQAVSQASAKSRPG